MWTLSESEPVLTGGQVVDVGQNRKMYSFHLTRTHLRKNFQKVIRRPMWLRRTTNGRGRLLHPLKMTQKGGSGGKVLAEKG